MTKKPCSLYVLGDSISMHYGPYLKKFIAPDFSYSRKGEGVTAGDLNIVSAANGGDSASVLKFLQVFLPAYAGKVDVLLWNCGLHDVKQADGRLQVSPEDYAANLQSALELIARHGVTPVWCRITPVYDRVHAAHCRDFGRSNANVRKYNAIADKVMKRARVPAIDLYAFSRKFGMRGVCDHVHFTEPVRQLQAAFIAGELQALRQAAALR